jgi:uncharacterized coiled-coil DUF342 family protein
MSEHDKLAAAIQERNEARKEVEQWKWNYDRLSKAASKKIESLEKDLAHVISERTPHDYGILKEEAQEMRKQRDEAREEAKRFSKIADLMHIERDQAREEVELLKQERDLWQQVQRDKAIVKESLTVRPEPSRLEIAAMTLAARSISTFYRDPSSEAQHALAAADALIIAAREDGDAQ